MADWIWNAAQEKGIIELEIDVLHDKVVPPELAIKPILIYLPRLRETIANSLLGNNFPVDFITEAQFIISLSHKFNAQRLLSCQAILKDKEGHMYEGKLYTEAAYERPFDAFATSWLDRFIAHLTKW